jgi:hypothetical protein
MTVPSHRYKTMRPPYMATLDQTPNPVDINAHISVFHLLPIIVRGHPSIPLLPLSLTMSICIPHGLYTYPTTPVPLRPPSDN